MRSFRKLFVLLTLLVFFSRCDKTGPEDPVDFPAGDFYELLLELGIDVNGDGAISYARSDWIETRPLLHRV